MESEALSNLPRTSTRVWQDRGSGLGQTLVRTPVREALQLGPLCWEVGATRGLHEWRSWRSQSEAELTRVLSRLVGWGEWWRDHAGGGSPVATVGGSSVLCGENWVLMRRPTFWSHLFPLLPACPETYHLPCLDLSFLSHGCLEGPVKCGL